MVFVSNALTRWEASIRLASHGISRSELDLKSFKKLTSYKFHIRNGLDRGFKDSTTQKEFQMKLTNGLTGVKKYVAMGLLAIVGLSSNVMAADPAYVTDLLTELGAIKVMVGSIIGAVVAIYLVPIAWGFIKRVIGRS